MEQEILKQRNGMLKYELESEKLAALLEEERKSQIEQDQCIKKQQMKIDNLSNTVKLPNSDRTEAPSHSSDVKERFLDGSTTNGSGIRCYEDRGSEI